jgi:hypothetical protein
MRLGFFIGCFIFFTIRYNTYSMYCKAMSSLITTRRFLFLHAKFKFYFYGDVKSAWSFCILCKIMLILLCSFHEMLRIILVPSRQYFFMLQQHLSFFLSLFLIGSCSGYKCQRFLFVCN